MDTTVSLLSLLLGLLARLLVAGLLALGVAFAIPDAMHGDTAAGLWAVVMSVGLIVVLGSAVRAVSHHRRG